MLDEVPLRGHGAVARVCGEIKHETLGKISHLRDHTIDLIRRSLKREPLINPSERSVVCATSPTVIWPPYSAPSNASGPRG